MRRSVLQHKPAAPPAAHEIENMFCLWPIHTNGRLVRFDSLAIALYISRYLIIIPPFLLPSLSHYLLYLRAAPLPARSLNCQTRIKLTIYTISEKVDYKKTDYTILNINGKISRWKFYLNVKTLHFLCLGLFMECSMVGSQPHSTKEKYIYLKSAYILKKQVEKFFVFLS